MRCGNNLYYAGVHLLVRNVCVRFVGLSMGIWRVCLTLSLCMSVFVAQHRVSFLRESTNMTTNMYFISYVFDAYKVRCATIWRQWFMSRHVCSVSVRFTFAARHK